MIIGMLPQFSLKRLLLSTAVIAVGMSGAVLPWRLSNQEFTNLPVIGQAAVLVLFWSCGALIGGGIGYLFRQTVAGVLAGYVVLLMIGLFLR